MPVIYGGADSRPIDGDGCTDISGVAQATPIHDVPSRALKPKTGSRVVRGKNQAA